MAHPVRPDDLAQLRATVLTLQADLARLKHRRRFPSRFLPLALVALLTALLPLSIVAAGPVFSDLETAAPVHQPNIQAIGDAGITTGFEDPNNPGQRTYNPKGLVTREEMATFLARTAGLGTNPPVVNAKTAVQSQTVGGYAPGALVRAHGVENANAVNLVNTSYTPIVSATITIPGPGYVLVNATTNIYDGTDLNTGGAQVRLTNYLFPTTYQEVLVGTGPGAVRETSVSSTYVYGVAPGERTFALEAKGFTNNVQAIRSTITLLYVPFGPEGTAPPGPKD